MNLSLRLENQAQNCPRKRVKSKSKPDWGSVMKAVATPSLLQGYFCHQRIKSRLCLKSTSDRYRTPR